MKLRSLQTYFVAMGQSRVQLQVQLMTSAFVLGNVPGQSGNNPALCSNKFLIVVGSFAWLAYSGIYFVTKSSISNFPSSQSRMMQVSVAVTLVSEAISKMVSLVKGGELKGIQFLVQWPKGQLQMVWVPFETRSTPPTNAPLALQNSRVSQTLVQSQSLAFARASSRQLKIKIVCNFINLIEYNYSQIHKNIIFNYILNTLSSQIA